MADTARDQDAPATKELGNALLLTASSIRRKLITRLDALLEGSPILDSATASDAGDALARVARNVHSDLEPLARQLGRFLALGPDALSAEHLRMLAQAGLQRTANRIGGLRVQQTKAADLSVTVRRHPIVAVLAALLAGYVLGRAVG